MAALRKQRILIAGAGPTGSVVASLLRAGLSDVTVWDKSRGAGGRASTTRVGDTQADLGLQYLSIGASTPPERRAVYETLASCGVISSMTSRLGGDNARFTGPDKSHFTVNEGASSLCKHFLTGTTTKFGMQISTILKTVDGSGSPVWEVTADGHPAERFDAVVLTIPVPQLFSLGGEVPATIDGTPGLRQSLEAVSYSSRWALALTFDVDAWSVVDRLEWDCKYVSSKENAAVCYLAVDHRKRHPGSTPASGPALVVHSGVPWSLKNGANLALDAEPEGLRESVEKELLGHTAALIPELFQGRIPTARKLHKWRYSQVFKGLQGGDGAVLASTSPVLIFSGDAFVDGAVGFDSCYTAAEAAVAHLKSQL